VWREEKLTSCLHARVFKAVNFAFPQRASHGRGHLPLWATSTYSVSILAPEHRASPFLWASCCPTRKYWWSPLPSIRPPKFRGVQEMSHVKRPKKVPRIGEHMSAVTLPDGTTPDIFGSGSGEEMATGLGVPLLGPIPLSPGLGEGEMLFRTGPLPVHTPLSPVATAESEASFRCPRSKLSPPAKQLLRG